MGAWVRFVARLAVCYTLYNNGGEGNSLVSPEWDSRMWDDVFTARFWWADEPFRRVADKLARCFP
jgi:hypothetical protein